jgi:hypothetical protein
MQVQRMTSRRETHIEFWQQVARAGADEHAADRRTLVRHRGIGGQAAAPEAAGAVCGACGLAGLGAVRVGCCSRTALSPATAKLPQRLSTPQMGSPRSLYDP